MAPDQRRGPTMRQDGYYRRLEAVGNAVALGTMDISLAKAFIEEMEAMCNGDCM